MTEEEQKAIAAWHAAVQTDQPDGTLAMLVHVRDGQVTLQHFIQAFPTIDLPTAKALIADFLDGIYARDTAP